MFHKIISIFILSIGIVCVVVLPITAQFPTDGVVGYWSFDEGTIVGGKVEDLLGNNDGELDGNPKVVAGKVGNALEFNGENSVHIPGTDTLDFNGADELSVVAWVNPDSDKPVVGVIPDTCCGTIVGQRDANGWVMRFDGRNPGKEMLLIVQPGWQGHTTLGVPPFPKNTWHHMVGVVNKDELLLYIDGKLESEFGYNGPIQTQGTETEIGNAKADGGFVGIIDEVLIYNRTVSANEAKQLFEARGLPVQPAGKLALRWGQLKAAP